MFSIKIAKNIHIYSANYCKINCRCASFFNKKKEAENILRNVCKKNCHKQIYTHRQTVQPDLNIITSQTHFTSPRDICSVGLLKGFTCIIIIILFCLLVSRLLTGCKILLQLSLAAVPDVSLRGEREMSKHLSDHHGAHAGATGNGATSPC